MTYKTDRRAALKLLTAAPLGLAMSAALAHEAVAQTPRGTFGARASTGPIEPGAGSWKTWPLSSGNELRSVAAQPAADANVINDWNATAVNVIVTDAVTGACGSGPLPRVRAGRRLQRRRRHHPPLRPLQVERTAPRQRPPRRPPPPPPPTGC